MELGPDDEITLQGPALDAQRMARVCGPLHQHLQLLEKELDVRIRNQEQNWVLQGAQADAARRIIERLIDASLQGDIDADTLHLWIRGEAAGDHEVQTPILLHTRKGAISPRGLQQSNYVRSILAADISFGIGPAGTGKTYLAVACAVHLLERDEIGRILLVRPAVEAGEKLGFLPGDLSEKINPYLRPLYDALYEMLGFDRVGKLLEKNIIEVAPLAYMRGRTLNHAFVILDEGQNTTPEQMKMFLTRLGFGSKAVITGDITQVDLPGGQVSGLRHAMEVLKGVDSIPITQFTSRDVVRHPLVQHIVEAYDRWDARHSKPLSSNRRHHATSD